MRRVMPSSVDRSVTDDPLDTVREVVRRHLPAGYEETASGAFTVWQVPLSRYSDTYNGKPLWYCALAAQKNYLSLYLMSAYGSPAIEQRLRDGFRKAGKKLDMGKSCIHFRSHDDLPLDVIGEIIAAIPVDKWVAIAQEARNRPARQTTGVRSARRASPKRRPK